MSKHSNRKDRETDTFRALETIMIDAEEKIQALRDMLDDSRNELNDIRESLGVSIEPHQTIHERLMEAAENFKEIIKEKDAIISRYDFEMVPELAVAKETIARQRVRIEELTSVLVFYANSQDIYQDKRTALYAENVLQRQANNSPYKEKDLYLPVLTKESIEEFGDTDICLVEYVNGVFSWSQRAVDFAVFLNLTCSGDKKESVQKAEPFKAAVIDALITNWAYQAIHETDARKAVQDLIAQEVSMALDPLISEAADNLQKKAKLEVLKEVVTKCCPSHSLLHEKSPSVIFRSVIFSDGIMKIIEDLEEEK